MNRPDALKRLDEISADLKRIGRTLDGIGDAIATLREAVILRWQAREAVADFVDGVARPRASRPAEGGEDEARGLLQMWAKADEERGRDPDRVMPKSPDWLEARIRLMKDALQGGRP